MDKKSSPSWVRPAQLTAVGFLLLILLGTGLLMLPTSSVTAHATPFLPAFFTATSAVSLTGLVVVDTETYWRPAGQAIILALIQAGGLGIMSLASLSGMLLTGRISLSARQRAAAEGRPAAGEGIRRTLFRTLYVTLFFEAIVATIVAARFFFHYGYSFKHSAWEGVFHAVSAFNNAGFSTHSANMIGFAHDAWILLPLAFALITGGLGYPVWAELLGIARTRVAVWRGHRRMFRRTTITTTMTLRATAFLLVAGTVMVAAAEWTGVLSGMSVGDKLLNAFFQGAAPRTAGFNSIDYGQAHPITLMGTDMLMFIGGGSAGTAGGVKLTTACVLLAAMAAEFLGREDTTIRRREIPHTVTRQALALTAAGVMVIAVGVAALRVMDPQFSADQVTFEVISAFATVGLSTGITAHLSAGSQIVLCFIMYLGRVGPTTLIAALAARVVSRRFNYPVERPLIG